MKHFLSLAELTSKEILSLIGLAVALKKQWKNGGNPSILSGKTLAMVFQKPSLRTRVSFDMAMLHLGGHALYLSPNEIALGKRESTGDVARVLSRYADAVMARVFGHKDILDLARYSRVPIINGLSDYNHPCQGLTDLLTIYERFEKFQGVKIAYIGDGNNVANSLIFGCTLVGADFSIATPIGYEITGDVVAKAQAFAAKTGSNLYFTHDPNEAVRNADVIYTDTWVSMGQEAEVQRRLELFTPRYQVNSALVAKAKRNAIVMHCLPAHRGREITDEIADGSQSAIWEQAENRMHAQKAILVRLLAPDAAVNMAPPAQSTQAKSKTKSKTKFRSKTKRKLASRTKTEAKARTKKKTKAKVRSTLRTKAKARTRTKKKTGAKTKTKTKARKKKR